jgi:ribonuclease BN (tRNA processing enzyme)
LVSRKEIVEMKVTVVGTGPASLRLRRRQSCVVVETEAETLVFDLGFRAVRGTRRASIYPLGVDRVFFTHFHGDHTVDVVPFLLWRRFRAGALARGTGKEARSRPFSISGPEPFLRFWRWRSRFWGRWLLVGLPAEVFELSRDHGGPLELLGCSLTWAPSDHRPESIAYRLDSHCGSFVYTGGTGYTETLVELARGAHTALIDCTFPNDRPFAGHLTPSGVARIASEAGVERVVLTHISPEAERLEHAVSDEFTERLAELLRHPERDPHGDLIPGPDGTMPMEDSYPLSASTEGTHVEVARIGHEDPASLSYLGERGLMPGRSMVVKEVRAVDGVVTVEDEEGATYSLGSSLADAIFVRVPPKDGT